MPLPNDLTSILLDENKIFMSGSTGSEDSVNLTPLGGSRTWTGVYPKGTKTASRTFPPPYSPHHEASCQPPSLFGHSTLHQPRCISFNLQDLEKLYSVVSTRVSVHLAGLVHAHRCLSVNPLGLGNSTNHSENVVLWETAWQCRKLVFSSREISCEAQPVWPCQCNTAHFCCLRCHLACYC